MGRWAPLRRMAALLLLALMFVAQLAAAGTVLSLDPARQPVPLGAAAESWIDERGTAQVQDVAANAALRWEAGSGTRVHALGEHKALWIRFTLPPAQNSDHWYLEIPYPGVDRVTLYARNASGEWIARDAGDRIPASSWPLPHRYPALPVLLSADQAQTHYLRIQNGISFGAPMQFVSDSYIASSEQGISLGLGVYFGLVLLAVIVAVVGAITLREHIYVLYAASAVLIALTQAAVTGIAGLHLWGERPWWNDMAPQVLPLVAVAVLQLFLAAVVSLRERSRVLHALLVSGALLSLPLAVHVMATPDAAMRLYILVGYFLLQTLASLAVLAWTALRGDRYAPWMLAGAVPMAIGAVLTMGRVAGLLPISFWTTHGMQIAMAAGLPVLLLVAMMRSQRHREHARRVQGLDRIDPATGLINSAVFHERLVRLIARSRRQRFRSAILLVEISNLEQVRRQFDDDSARELNLRVAGRLLSVAREIDTVARLSEHRFGVLIEGPLHADEVAAAGPRIVARCLMPFKGRPLEWSAHVRVAQALIPMDGTDPDQLIGRLEMLLATAPVDNRRSVFMLSRIGAPALAS
jgi:two-component system, sensor histidine kinase LadS